MIKLLKKYTTDGEEMAASFVQVLQSMCNYHFMMRNAPISKSTLESGSLMLIEGD